MTDTLAVVVTIILGHLSATLQKNPTKLERMKAYLFSIKTEKRQK